MSSRDLLNYVYNYISIITNFHRGTVILSPFLNCWPRTSFLLLFPRLAKPTAKGAVKIQMSMLKKLSLSNPLKEEITLNCTCTLVSVGFSEQQNRINQHHFNHWFLPLLGFCHTWKNLLSPYFFRGKSTFSLSLHCQTVLYIEWIWPTDLVIIHIKVDKWKSKKVGK